eukprot:6938946-Karenia_brevis.AAC.1
MSVCAQGRIAGMRILAQNSSVLGSAIRCIRSVRPIRSEPLPISQCHEVVKMSAPGEQGPDRHSTSIV